MKRFLFLMLVMCLASVVNAQFSNNQTICCFIQYKRVTDGIPEKFCLSGSNMVYFVYFHSNGLMNLYETTVSSHRKNSFKNPNYYRDKINDQIATAEYKLKHRPTNGMDIIEYKKFNSHYSTNNKYTYQRYVAQAVTDYTSFGAVYFKWGPFEIIDANNFIVSPSFSYCYTFTTDLSEMIVWNLANPESQNYYKRINIESLGEVDLDFLK